MQIRAPQIVIQVIIVNLFNYKIMCNYITFIQNLSWEAHYKERDERNR